MKMSVNIHQHIEAEIIPVLPVFPAFPHEQASAIFRTLVTGR